MKEFLEWIDLKEKLHTKDHRPPHVSEGDIWWSSLGENVGSEINGKSDLFSRPAIIIKKLSHGFYLVAPTSSKVRQGTWYVKFRQKEQDRVACLHQIRKIDYAEQGVSLTSVMTLGMLGFNVYGIAFDPN